MGQKESLIYEIIVKDKGSSTLSGFGLNIESLTKSVISMGKSIYDTIIDAGRNFAQFEDVLSHARRTMSLNREDTLGLGDALMDLSTGFQESGLKAGVSADELAKISGVLGQLGFNARENTDQFLTLAATVAKVSTAFGMTSAKAAEGLGILKNLYNLPVEKIENAASSIAHLGNTTVATSGQLLTFMQRVGGIAGLLGVTAQEAAALGATLRESGVTANLAGTSMSQIFSRMASDVDRFGEVLKKGGVSGEMLRMKIESGKATEALQMVLKGLQSIQAREGKIAATQALKDLGLSGVRVQQTLLALSNNIAGLNKNLAASDKAFQENTAVNDAYQSSIDNTSKKWEQFINLIDIIKKLIGQDLALAFSDFLDNYLIPFTDEFKDWLKESEGAKAIFGRDGLIASGLDWIGEKLYENKNGFLEWLEMLDIEIPKGIDYLKEKFGEFWEKLKKDNSEFIRKFGSISAAIENIGKAWDFMVENTEKWGKALQPLLPLLQPLWEISIGISNAMFKMSTFAAEMIKVFTDIGTILLNKVTPSITALTEKLGGVLDKIILIGEIALYGSVFPDLAKGTAIVTSKTEGLNDVYVGTHGQLKNIYRTGENTFSNLTRDVELYHEAFQNSGWKANTDVQYHLTQTGEAVGQLGLAYRQAGEEAEKSAVKMQKVQDVQKAIRWEVEAMQKVQELASQQPGATNMTSEQWAGLSSDQIADLINRPGLFSAHGIMEGLNQQRMRAVEERPSTRENIPIEATFVFGDQEIGNMVAVIEDRQQQENRRKGFSIAP